MIPDQQSRRYISTDSFSTFNGILVDVRTPEAFAEAHLSGAVNYTVYQVDFMENFPKAYPDKATPILVYGDGDPYKADLAALGRLQALGYTDVSILEGGLSQWLAESRPVEGSGPSDDSGSAAGRFGLDAEKTKVRWVGRNLMNQHNGEIQATGGFMEASSEGTPLSGVVTVDLRQMVTLDITDKDMAAMLIGHLASADFFDVENHPEASFKLTGAKPIAKATYGMPNFKIKGTLFARGLSVDLEIEALIEAIDGGYVFQSAFSFDRTQLGALYGSGRIFERLGMHLVNDLVSMDITAFFTVAED